METLLSLVIVGFGNLKLAAYGGGVLFRSRTSVDERTRKTAIRVNWLVFLKGLILDKRG